MHGSVQVMSGLIEFPLCMCFVCACVCVITLTPLFTGIHIIITLYMQCIHNFRSYSCMANICLERIMVFNPVYTLIIIFITFVLFCELRYLSLFSDWLWADRSRDWVLLGARFSAAVKTGPGAYPASCTVGTRFFLGDKVAGVWRFPPTPM